MQKNTNGLATKDIQRLRETYGYNEMVVENANSFLSKILHIIKEPMFILLILTASIYFFLGEPLDGSIMMIFVVSIVGIEIYQEWRTDKTVAALKDLSAPTIDVIRDGKTQEIHSRELLPGDLMLIHEGVKVPADGRIIESDDLFVNESMLSGESEPVWKVTDADSTTDIWRRDYVYTGTLVIQGYGKILVEKIGNQTVHGKIGMDIAAIEEEATPLQVQMRRLVSIMSKVAVVLFLLVCGFTYLTDQNPVLAYRIVHSILSGITLAMAIIPEEFPVIFTVFMSMGAWRLAKKKSLVRKMSSVETLGAIDVLCVDKTGTLTMNQMTVQDVISQDKDHFNQILALACEVTPYDPMEIAMHDYAKQVDIDLDKLYQSPMVTEYPFSNERKNMGHVWAMDEGITIAVKGAPESVLELSNLSAADKAQWLRQAQDLSEKGQRVIAVAYQQVDTENDIPETIEGTSLTLLGLVGLIDPPRESVAASIRIAHQAGIKVVMITGDNGITAQAIAKQVGITEDDIRLLTGKEIDAMSDDDLIKVVGDIDVFSRVVPEHKMRIVKALKETGKVVAMTGDGVNDASALKFANIGIAMGQRGSDVARESSDIILLDDNFATIVSTIEDGRRIYDNIRKAIGYVFTIHIPIVLIALFTSILGFGSGTVLLLPIHIVFLELIIDPTCSVVLERQPADTGLMNRAPRKVDESLVTPSIVVKSILQGLVIFAMSFASFIYYADTNIDLARTMAFSILIIANIMLVFVNSSDKDSLALTLKKIHQDKVMWIILLMTALVLVLSIYTPLNSILQFTYLSLPQLMLVLALGAISVLWYEGVKWIKGMTSSV